MLSVSKIQDAGAAKAYYEHTDDYYSQEAGASSAWVGKGAHELGLTGTGPVDPETFEAALRGSLPDGSVIGNPGTGHAPGWDLTFSAPKSVSALALAAGDERLIKAHDEAVRAAIVQIEERAAVTRVKESGGRIRLEYTRNLAVATFRHETSREQDPQLHTHCVVLNATLTERGWRSIESREIYKLQKEGGEIYRAELAARVAQLGYQIEHTHVGEGKAASRGFEIHDVPQDLLDHWSSRSQQVEAALAARGKTRETATAEEREKAALDSRKAKEVSDHAVLRDRWHGEAKAHGIDLERLAAASRASEKEARMEWYKDEGKAAREALAFAIAKLEERNAVFTSQELIREARLHGMGGIQERAIHEAIYHAQVAGDLKARAAEVYNPATGRMEKVEGFTSRAAIENERAMLAAAGRLKAGQAAMSQDKAIAAVAQASARSEHAFNAGQRDAALHILSTPENLVLIQGYAGTAKTTSVLACASTELQKQGYTVKALAPTASAAQTLGDAIGARADTMQSHLVSREQPSGRQVWILDEASLASARDMKTLLEKADREQAKVVLVGDVKQLGSVEAGAAFRQLQEHAPVRAQVLDEIVRQRDAELKAAVYDAIRGDARAALEKIEVREIVHQRDDGTVDKAQSHRDRLEAMAKDYASMARADRDKTLVIAPARADRAAINDQVRQHLTEKGELGREEVKLQTYVAKDLTRAETRDARSYRAGETIEFQRDYKSIGVEKGERWKVEHVDTRNNTLRVSKDGKETSYDPSKHTKTQALESREIGVRQGDKLTYTANGDRKAGEINGRQFTVEKLDAANGRAVLKDEYGHRREVETKDLARVDHAYCQTAHQAQGKTCDRVMALAESNQVNLTNQKSLYVEVSRAKDKAVVYTDSKEVVSKGIEARSGEKQTALDRVISNGPSGPGAGRQSSSKEAVAKGTEARPSPERGGNEAGRAPVRGGLER